MQPMRPTLSDGTQVVIRPIEPGDRARLSTAMGRLSREAIHQRFMAAKPTLSGAELSYFTEIDGFDHLALVAVLPEDPEEPIVAVARCVRLEPGGDTAEFAIVVGDRFQGRRLGTALARALADAAAAVGIRRFAATALSTNVAITRLMQTFTTRLEQRTEGSVRELSAVLTERTPLSAAA
jgi:RimJ/RimL family protein N-acetyltransferase